MINTPSIVYIINSLIVINQSYHMSVKMKKHVKIRIIHIIYLKTLIVYIQKNIDS